VSGNIKKQISECCAPDEIALSVVVADFTVKSNFMLDYYYLAHLYKKAFFYLAAPYTAYYLLVTLPSFPPYRI
jgi:hypothetical protein